MRKEKQQTPPQWTSRHLTSTQHVKPTTRRAHSTNHALYLMYNKKKTIFDCWNGYHSVPLHKDDHHLTTIITPWGRYRYKTAPHGYIASGDGYSRQFDEIVSHIPNVQDQMHYWSKNGIGYWLFQKHCQCLSTEPFCCRTGWKITLVGSRFTPAAKSRYAPVEGEALAVVDALDKARFFILGCSNLIIAVIGPSRRSLMADSAILRRRHYAINSECHKSSSQPTPTQSHIGHSFMTGIRCEELLQESGSPTIDNQLASSASSTLSIIHPFHSTAPWQSQGT
ncbi:hypothetical protein QZH41_013512, partial [Actinostola sp. cb2023]